MLIFETYNIDAAFAELSNAASQFFHDRLIAPPKRSDVTIMLRVAGVNTGGGYQFTAGVQRSDMLAQKIDGQYMPNKSIDFNIIHDGDVAATMLHLAHEWVHIGQIVSGRYMLVSKGQKRIAFWLGRKIGVIDKIPYHIRPWEIEAHEWQQKLVTEFIDQMSLNDAA